MLIRICKAKDTELWMWKLSPNNNDSIVLAMSPKFYKTRGAATTAVSKAIKEISMAYEKRGFLKKVEYESNGLG